MNQKTNQDSTSDMEDTVGEPVQMPEKINSSTILCEPVPGSNDSNFDGSLPDSVYNWVEVTDSFLSATKELKLGELLHDEMFGLFEAMSAIEMMDPKMDAGMICNRLKAKPFDFNTAVQANHLKLNEGLTRSEQIAVIDKTFACLVTWIEGHSLAQTVFTNLYLHQPYEVTNPLMKAFSIVILKLVDLIKDFVSRGSVYEEEDFQPVIHGFKLATDVSELRAGGMIREVEEDLQRVIRGTKAKDEQDDRSPNVIKEHEESKALFARMKFTRQFYLGLVGLYRWEIPDGLRNLNGAKDQINIVKESIRLGEPDPEDPKRNLMGFDRLANQRLLPPTFPRYTEIKSRSDAVEYLESLVDRLKTGVDITQKKTFQASLDFVADFGVLNSCILSRSVVQALFQPLQSLASLTNRMASNEVKNRPLATPFHELLKEACKSFISPPALTSKAAVFQSRQMKDCVDNFFIQCTRPMGLLFQAFGHNRARQRDKLAALLEEFSAIQEEADKLDAMLNNLSSSPSDPTKHPMLFFSTWLLYHILKVMIRFVLSGFELELYSHHEYPYLYWYLYELLYPWLTTCLHRADTYLQEQEQISDSKKNKKKVKNNNKKKGLRPFAKEITYCQAYASLCAGYFKLVGALKEKRKIVIPDTAFDNEAVRYDHRFAPFGHLLTPPLMPYGQFYEVYNHTIVKNESNAIFLAASRDFQRARQIFESLLQQNLGDVSELNKLISLTKTNFVASCVLTKDCSRRVEFDFNLHATYPTVKFM